MNLNEEFLRFHNTEHLKKEVSKKGYISGEIGERSKTDAEIQERIYFSKGVIGIYKIAAQMMLDLIYRNNGFDKKQEYIYSNVNDKEKRNSLISEMEKELKSIRLNDEEKNSLFLQFEIFYKNYTYMLVNLEEGKDYDLNDNRSLANMHTIEGIKIPIDKIKILGVNTEQGLQTNGFEFLKYVYKNHRNIEPMNRMSSENYYIQLLDECMEKAIFKQKENVKLDVITFDEYINSSRENLMKKVLDMGEDECTSEDLKFMANYLKESQNKETIENYPEIENKGEK